MKKLIAAAPTTLVILYSFIPMLYLVGFCGGYTLVLRFAPELIALLGIYSLVVLYNLSDYELEMDKPNIILSTLTLPLAFLTVLCILADTQSFGSIILCLVCMYCGYVLLGKTTSNPGIKRIHKAIAVIFAIILAVYTVTSLSLTAYDSSASEPVLSPSGAYTAEIIRSGQSATVEVRETNRTIELYVFYYEDTPQRIFIDNLDPAQEVSIVFTDDQMLLINDAAYPIS